MTIWAVERVYEGTQSLWWTEAQAETEVIRLEADQFKLLGYVSGRWYVEQTEINGERPND